MGTIEIPVHNSPDEVIEIDFRRLPKLEDVKMILLDEKVRLKYWIRVALELYNCNRVEDFVHLLEASGREANVDYPEAKKDQLLALDTLAAYYLMKAQNCRRLDDRRDCLAKATALYAMADNIFVYEEYHLLGRAFLCLLEGTSDKLEQAETQFSFVLEKNPRNVPAILGKASIFFKRSDYNGALELYRTAIRIAPNCPAEVRLAMGHCFFKLGNLEKAQLALERALALNPDCMDALAGLAIMDLNRGSREDLRMGIEKLSAVYQRDGDNPIVLVGLADHFFFKRDSEHCRMLALHAFNVSENDGLRAQACYLLGRALHDEGDLNQAYQYYYQSTLFDKPKYLLPLYGLGQIYIQRNEIEKAINCMEKIANSEPNFVNATRILGSLYSLSDSRERRAKAQVYLKKAVEMLPYDAEAIIEYAEALQDKEGESALEMFERAIEALKETGNENSAQSPEIFNNIGALHFRAKRFDEAENYFQRAIRAALDKLSKNEAYYKSIIITATYNLGRVNESLRCIDLAEKIYKDILLQSPNYIDCYLRLGCMARDRGQIYDASVWFKEALQFNQTHTTAWMLIGNLHLSKKEWGPAQKKYERILRQQESSRNLYSLVALGNIWLLSMQQNIQDATKDQRYLERAYGFYRKALSLSPRNVYACNGVGCVLAYLYCFKDARDIFTRVREAVVNFPDVWLNIAHVYMEQDQPAAALSLYESAIKKFGYENNVEVQLILSRAYFRANKLRECKRTLLRARVLAPFDPVVLYNLALTLQRLATKTLKDPTTYLNDVLEAVKNLEEAHKYFAHLTVNAANTSIDANRAMALARKCKDLLAQTKNHVERARELDQQMRRLRQEREEKLRLALERQQQIQREKEEAARRLREEQDQRRLLFVERTKQLLSLPDPTLDKPKSSKAKQKRSESDFLNDDSDLGFSPGKAERSGRKRKRQRKRSHRGGETSDGRGDEGEPKKHRRKQAKEISDLPARKVKSRAILSSASSSDEEPPILHAKTGEEGEANTSVADTDDADGIHYLHKMLFSEDEDETNETPADDNETSSRRVIPEISSTDEEEVSDQ